MCPEDSLFLSLGHSLDLSSYSGHRLDLGSNKLLDLQAGVEHVSDQRRSLEDFARLSNQLEFLFDFVVVGEADNDSRTADPEASLL